MIYLRSCNKIILVEQIYMTENETDVELVLIQKFKYAPITFACTTHL